MRLLIGMPDPTTRSGPTACEPPFVAALRALGVEVTEETYVYGDNLDATGLAARVRRVAGTARRLRGRTRATSFDLVHLNTSFDHKTVLRDTFTLGAIGRQSPPIFLKLHGSDHTMLTSGPRAFRFLARRVLGRASAIGVLSSEERASFVAAGVPEEKLHLVPNALPAPSTPFTSSREAFLAAYGLPATTPLVLFISRLVPTKGLLDVVRACGILRDRGRPVVLCCVGDGPAREEAETEAALLGLGRNARFFGYLSESEASAFYRYSDVLSFPTFHHEGLPIVLLNALAAGLPIITTPTRGALDYLAEPDTCLWVQPHDPEQVADRLAELLADDALRAAMGARAREQAQTFDPAKVARDYLDVYRRVLTPVRSATGGVERAPAVDPDAEAPSSESRIPLR